MKIRILIVTLLSALIAIVGPYVLFRLSGLWESGLDFEMVRSQLHRHPEYSNRAYFIAAVAWFFGVLAASGTLGGGSSGSRRGQYQGPSDDYRAPTVEFNTNGAPMCSGGGIDVTGHVQGDTRI